MASDYRLSWMRSVLRLEVSSNPFEWDDEEVVFAFAARPKPVPVSYEEWCLRMGLGEPMKKEAEAEQNDAALAALKVGGGPNIVIQSAQRPE
jgi:hypothetical protein